MGTHDGQRDLESRRVGPQWGDGTSRQQREFNFNAVTSEPDGASEAGSLVASHQATQTVCFPNSRSIGTIYVRDFRTIRWSRFADARGVVQLPGSKQLRLKINRVVYGPAGAHELLRDVDLNRFHEIEIRYPISSRDLMDGVLSGSDWVDRLFAEAEEETRRLLGTTAQIVIKRVGR